MQIQLPYGISSFILNESHYMKIKFLPLGARRAIAHVKAYIIYCLGKWLIFLDNILKIQNWKQNWSFPNFGLSSLNGIEVYRNINKWFKGLRCASLVITLVDNWNIVKQRSSSLMLENDANFKKFRNHFTT